MKFTVINDENHEFDLKLEFSEDEKENSVDCLYDIALGCSRVILEMVKHLSEKEKAQKVAEFLIEQIKESVDMCIEDYYNTEATSILEHSLYDIMEKAFYDWLENLDESHGIYNEKDFIKECQNRKVEVDYVLNDCAEVNVFISLDDWKETLDIQYIPVSLLDENENRFDAHCHYCEFVATVAFDKLYGEDKNPLRNNDLWNLTCEIKKSIQMRRETDPGYGI